MRQIVLSFFTALICLTACNITGERVINRPVFGVSNTATIEFDKIVLTDSATIFYIDAYYTPKYWIRISGDTYLQAGDKKYPISGAEGITLDDEFWMPESGEASFQLFFPPIDPSLKAIDFIESDCDGCFKIYGIDLTGKAKYPGKPEGVPAAVAKQPDMTAPLPQPQLKIGETTVTIHLLGYKKGMDDGKAQFVGMRIFPSSEEEMEAAIDDNGIVTLQFEQYGTQMSVVRAAGQRFTFMTDPGENAEIYIDLREMSRQRSRYHKTDVAGRTFYSSGKYAAVNLALNENLYDYKFDIATNTRELMNDVEAMTPAQYINYVTEKYDAIANKVDSSALTPVEKALLTIDNKFNLHYAVFLGETLLEHVYRQKNDIPRDKPAEGAIKFSEIDYDVLSSYKIDGYDYMYAQLFYLLYTTYFNDSVNLEHITGEREGLLFDLKKAYKAASKVKKSEALTDEDRASLAEVKEPFYAQALDALEAHNKKQLEEAMNKGGFTICEVPKTSEEKLFDAIMANYKGKTALVDFWATWCGPCRSAIRKTEPLKDNELKDDNLVFVYITGPSSPQNTWLQMLGDIKGDHYRLDEKQWNYVCKQFDIDGIPSYVLLKKSGDYALRNDFRDHSKMKQTLLEEIGK
ncbi:MAG: TlpA family protein disulfide reductase [Tannerella sp.]|jgi:thiol-disulfide isomerase/thioredoxin|nr:TlpA family protein disulfide reductase [Tannerella sp.]